jgi:exodeoxyribonuclease V beta subunit
VHVPWRIGSFSGLTAGHDVELPDHDAVSLPVIEKEPTVFQQDRFAFPKGAKAGTCLHAILEHWDFVDQGTLVEEVTKQLRLFGFDEKWLPVVVEWISEVVATPLDEAGVALNQISKSQRIDEMAFYFPVANLTVSGLQKALVPHLQDDVLAAVLKRLSFYDLSGFMKGFIDLVFEYQGKFYVVDYKSNFLGSSPDDYQTDRLNDAMLAHDYPLQYLIYTLALHRYLKLRLADYDPAQHLGGVKYLFLRGMKADWQQAGIFSAHVDLNLLSALDGYLNG